jgi:hypothetical protein
MCSGQNFLCKSGYATPSFPIRDDKGRAALGGITEETTKFDGSPIYVVDGHESARLLRLLQTAGHDVKTFPSARSFLEVAPSRSWLSFWIFLHLGQARA